jgi:hypothetical protein
MAFCFFACLTASAQKYDTLCTKSNLAIIGEIYTANTEFYYIITNENKKIKVAKDVVVPCNETQLKILRNGDVLQPQYHYAINIDSNKTISGAFNKKQNPYLIKAGGFLAVSIVGTIAGSVLSSVGAVTGKPGLAYAGVGIGGVSLLLNIGTAVNLIKAGKRYEYKMFVP